MSIGQIIKKVETFKTNLVELTGGEPLLNESSLSLITELCDRKYQVLIETNGSIDIAPVDPRAILIMDLKCPFSGESESMLWKNLDYIRSKDEIKFVIGDKKDYEWALQVIQKYKLEDKCELLFSCVFTTLKPETLVKWILESNIKVRMQLQLHKFIWDPNQRRV